MPTNDTDTATNDRPRITAIRPGILVGLHVSHEGGREYDVRKRDVATEGAREVIDIISRRTVYDRAEWDRAEKCRTTCRSTVERICIRTDFGPLCPVEREGELWAAVAEARATAEAFNQSTRYSRIVVRVLPARIASTDAEAAYSIASEVGALIRQMQGGIERAGLPGQAGDAVKQIREAADRAKRLGAMLTDDNAARVNSAIEAARKVARDIVRRVEKGGELAVSVVAELASESSAIEAARFSFLDLEEQLRPAGAALPAVDVQRFAEVGEETAGAAPAEKPEPAESKPPAALPELELEAPAVPAPAATPAVATRDIELPPEDLQAAASGAADDDGVVWE